MVVVRAVQVSGPGEGFEVVERPVPEPGPDQVRIAVEACGVCGGDSVAREGAPPVEYPRVPGHEVAGRIDAVGDRVSGWTEGDRVAVGWYASHCHSCAACRRGRFTDCENGTIAGVHDDGGYAEFTLANPEALVPVPDGMSAAVAAPLVCAGLTGFNALRNADLVPDDLVAVQGIGGVGHLALQYADAFGHETVALSGSPSKEAAAREFGADHFVASETDAGEALSALGGADLVLATAPSRAAIESVLGGLAPRGEVLAVAAPEEPVRVPVGGLINGRRTVRGWSSGHAGDAADTLAFSARHGIDPRVETYPLAEADAAYRAMQDGDVRFRAVLTP